MKRADPKNVLDIRLFGPMDLRIGPRSLLPMRTRKCLYLLALLCLRYDRAVQRKWLIDILWPDSSPKQGAYNLRRALYELRTALGAFGERLSAPTQNSLRLEGGQDIRIDVLHFDALIRKDDPALLQ